MSTVHKTHDLHLSALSISRASRECFERWGFVRDDFANNRRCVASAYHASYSGPKEVPDSDLWNAMCSLLLKDSDFVGHLEEERTIRREVLEVPVTLEEQHHGSIPFVFEPVPPGAHKVCDIHLGIELAISPQSATDRVEALGMISFDKSSESGVRRVYTVTCETEDDGVRIFDKLSAIAKGLPGLVGKIKLEAISRYLRHPRDAEGLPILSSQHVREWLS